MSTEADVQYDACSKAVDDAIVNARMTYDYRIVMAVLLQHAASMAQAAISAKVATEDQMGEYFYGAHRLACTPRERSLRRRSQQMAKILGGSIDERFYLQVLP